MIDNKLKVGDIIVITHGETENYLQIGKVIDIRPYMWDKYISISE